MPCRNRCGIRVLWLWLAPALALASLAEAGFTQYPGMLREWRAQKFDDVCLILNQPTTSCHTLFSVQCLPSNESSL